MRRVAVICAITASLFFGPSVQAALHDYDDHTLDQSQEEWNYGYAVGIAGGSTMMAQTFTPGVDGTLCHIQIGNTTDGVVWYPASPPVVEIRNTVEYAQGLFRPGSTILGSVTLSYPVPYYDEKQHLWITPDTTGSPGPVGWTPLIDFSVPIDADVMYSIVLSSLNQPGAVSVGATGYTYDSYEAGALWAYKAGTWQLLSGLRDIPVWDMQFRTYVVPVPLPAGLWLGVFAVSVAGWHLKRQRG